MNVTVNALTAAVSRLNDLAGVSAASATYLDAEGAIYWRVGRYCLDIANGGYKLVIIRTPEGATSDALGTGFVSKRELLDAINTFMRGIETRN